MDNSQVQIVLQLVVAVILGGVIGLERKYKKREAGLQTYSLVALGACLFTVIACELFYFFMDRSGISFDPSRIIQAVAIGIGFIGAGVIIYRQFHVEGLTTATGLWATAAIGVAVGIRLYFTAIFGTLLIVFILVVFGGIERKFFKKD